jgi:hypothetical protein
MDGFEGDLKISGKDELTVMWKRQCLYLHELYTNGDIAHI